MTIEAKLREVAALLSDDPAFSGAVNSTALRLSMCTDGEPEKRADFAGRIGADLIEALTAAHGASTAAEEINAIVGAIMIKAFDLATSFPDEGGWA